MRVGRWPWWCGARAARARSVAGWCGVSGGAVWGRWVVRAGWWWGGTGRGAGIVGCRTAWQSLSPCRATWRGGLSPGGKVCRQAGTVGLVAPGGGARGGAATSRVVGLSAQEPCGAGGGRGVPVLRFGRRAWCACPVRYGPGWTVVREPGGRPVVVDLSGDARWGGRRRPGSRGEPGRWSVTPSPSGGRSGSAAERGRRRRSVSGWRLVSRCRTPWRRGRAARRPPGPPSGRSPRRGRRSPRRRPP